MCYQFVSLRQVDPDIACATLAVEVHAADVIVKGLADDLMSVCDGVFINDFLLICQGVQFIVLVPAQAVIQPDLHVSSFPLTKYKHKDTQHDKIQYKYGNEHNLIGECIFQICPMLENHRNIKDMI